MTSNHSRAMAPSSPACCFIQASMAGSYLTVPLNRRRFGFMVIPSRSLQLIGMGNLAAGSRKSRRYFLMKEHKVFSAAEGGCDPQFQGTKRKRPRSFLNAALD